MAAKLRLASSGGDMKIWDMPELNMVKAFSPHSQPVGSLCWSPNSIFLFIEYCVFSLLVFLFSFINRLLHLLLFLL